MVQDKDIHLWVKYLQRTEIKPTLESSVVSASAIGQRSQSVELTTAVANQNPREVLGLHFIVMQSFFLTFLMPVMPLKVLVFIHVIYSPGVLNVLLALTKMFIFIEAASAPRNVFFSIL